MSNPTTATTLVMSRDSEGFNGKLIYDAIGYIRANPFRNVHLRVPQKSTTEYIQFINEMFGGSEREEYSDFWNSMLDYAGTEKSSFEVPQGFLNVRVNPIQKKIVTDFRTNIFGEVSHLNMMSLLSPSGQEQDVYTETSVGTNGEIKRSNAVFVSRYFIVEADEKPPKGTEYNDKVERITYSNKKTNELLEAMRKKSDVTSLDLSVYHEDSVTELLYAVRLPKCIIEIDPTKSESYSFSRLRYIFGMLQEYYVSLKNTKLVISNEIELVNGKPRPTKFKYAFVPNEVKYTGGTVVTPNNVSDEKIHVPLDPFNGVLFGFGNFSPEIKQFHVMKTMLSYFNVFGFHPEEEDFTGYNSDAYLRGSSEGKTRYFAKVPQHEGTNSGGRGRGAPPPYTNTGGRGNFGGRSMEGSYRGRGRGRSTTHDDDDG